MVRLILNIVLFIILAVFVVINLPYKTSVNLFSWVIEEVSVVAVVLMSFVLGMYCHDRKTYHVSARLSRVPRLESLADNQLQDMLDQFDSRQVLHVTFGSVLQRFGSELHATLKLHEEVHYTALETHFRRHLESFV